MSNEHLIPAQTHDLKILKSLGGKKSGHCRCTLSSFFEYLNLAWLTGPSTPLKSMNVK